MATHQFFSFSEPVRRTSKHGKKLADDEDDDDDDDDDEDEPLVCTYIFTWSENI